MRCPGRLLTGLLFVASAFGCSVVGHPGSRDMPNVWVGSDGSAAVMIQVVRTGNTLSGTLDEAGLDDPGAVSVKPVHAAFTGSVDREAITLTFPEGLGFSSSLSGTVTGRRMSLRVAQENGAVATVTLQPGTVDQYNRLIAGVNGQASANASASAAAAVDAAQARAEDEARQRVDAAAATVADDLRALREAIDDKPDFGDFDGDIATARDDLAAARNDAAQAGSDDPAAACSDATAAQSDESAVQSDSSSIDSDVSALGSNVDAVNSAVADLEKDLDDYHTVAAGAPGYRPAAAPDESAVASAIGTAHATIKGWKGRADSYRSTVAGLLAKASDVADQAVRKYC